MRFAISIGRFDTTKMLRTSPFAATAMSGRFGQSCLVALRRCKSVRLAPYAMRPPAWAYSLSPHIAGSRVFVLFDDGDSGWVEANLVFPLEFKVGDVVWIEEHRPISRLKRWIVVGETAPKA